MGDCPPQKVRGEDGGAFIPPQYVENVLQIYTVKRIKMKEKEDETHVCDRHTSIIYPIPIYYDTV